MILSECVFPTLLLKNLRVVTCEIPYLFIQGHSKEQHAGSINFDNHISLKTYYFIDISKIG
jgi:hypothetical protein